MPFFCCCFDESAAAFFVSLDTPRLLPLPSSNGPNQARTAASANFLGAALAAASSGAARPLVAVTASP